MQATVSSAPSNKVIKAQMERLKLLRVVMRRLQFDRIIAGFVVFLFVASAIIAAVEPGIHGLGEGLWYSFVACTSIGFGDLVAVTFTGRLLTVIITIYEILIVAMFSGVVVSYYLEVVHRRENETLTAFLDRLEHLTELSDEELSEMQDQVTRFKKGR
ncbi:MAG: two pore domain potassium channel family protein [Clostridiales bacterium]|nr:two pore domain potassium channel family protein [Clostridiales bacterium]